MGGTRSMAQQLNYALNENRRIGESKRNYKMTHEGRTNSKIFSNVYSKNLHDTAKSLGKYMREMYPEVRMANQIRSEHVQSYIDTMAPNWSAKTIENKISQIQKIGECIRTTFPTKSRDEKTNKRNTYFTIERPEAVARQNVRNVAMSQADIAALRGRMAPDSNARRCMEITARCGLRVNEVACLKKDNINLERHVIEVREGSKNGKWRDVPIRDKDMPYFRDLVAKTNHEYITHGIHPNSLNQGIRREMKELKIDEKYLCTTNHAIRKAYASERMQEEREDGKTERQAWSVVQQELGHGADFRQALYDTYVK